MYVENLERVSIDDVMKVARREEVNVGVAASVTTFNRPIKVAHTHAEFGSSRAAFVCPRCAKIVRVVFRKKGGDVGCRQCLSLTNLLAASRRSPAYPLLRLVLKLKKAEGQLERKGIHAKTRERLRHRQEELLGEIRALLATWHIGGPGCNGTDAGEGLGGSPAGAGGG